MPRTWSLCPFFNELDVLEIRLAELDPVVDVHVIAEATVTYSGAPKPLNFLEHRERFRRWERKIRYIVVDDMPMNGMAVIPTSPMSPTNGIHWRRENHQRDALIRGLDGLQDDDLVLLADCDEFPSRYMVKFAPNLLRELPPQHCCLRPALPLHVGYLNFRWRHPVPVICRFVYGRTIRIWGVERIRKISGFPYFDKDHCLGWHLSYMGGPEAVVYKIQSAAHPELMKPQNLNTAVVAQKITAGRDIFEERPGGPKDAIWVGLDELPEYVRENRDRFAHMLVENPAKREAIA